MFALIPFFTIISLLHTSVLGDVSKINDVQACMEFCSLSSSIGSLKDGQCTCENVDNKDTKDVSSEPRQLEQVDPNLYTKDLTDEERTARCTLGSRNRLRHHDADRVVKYFVNDGPSLGHSYFVGGANPYDSTENECTTENNPSTDFYPNSDDSNNPQPVEQVYELVQDNSYRPDYSNTFVEAPYEPYNSAYFPPVAMNPYGPVMDSPYGPLVGSSNYILSPPAPPMRPSSRDRLVGAKLPRRAFRPRLNALKHFSNALLGLVKVPVSEGLLGAHSLLHSLTKPDLIAYSAPYINDLNTIGSSAAENIITEANPIVSVENENAQTVGVDQETASENKTQESYDMKNSADLVPPTQRSNIIPTGNFQNIPYNQQYFMPLYSPYYDHPGAFLNSMPRAYILKPVKLQPQAAHSAQQTDVVAIPKPQNSSDCKNNTSSDNKDNNMDSADETTEKSKDNIDTTDSSITKVDNKGTPKKKKEIK